jgi:hypothetical protein
MMIYFQLQWLHNSHGAGPRVASMEGDDVFIDEVIQEEVAHAQENQTLSRLIYHSEYLAEQ